MERRHRDHYPLAGYEMLDRGDILVGGDFLAGAGVMPDRRVLREHERLGHSS